VTTNNLFSIL